MAVYYPKSLARLVGEFEKLPGIGPKSAQRLAFHVMRVPEDETRSLADALMAVKGSIDSAPSATTTPRATSATSAPTPAATTPPCASSPSRAT